MTLEAINTGKKTAGAVRIRLHEPVQPGASDEELMEEITIRLSRQSAQPESQPQPQSNSRERKASAPGTASTPRILAQLSLLGLAIYIGFEFGALACLAFILFVCLPIATVHWTVVETEDRHPTTTGTQ